MRSRTLPLVALVVLAALAAGSAGCSAPKVLVSVWPRATAERAIPKPAVAPRWPLTGLDAPSADAVKVRVVSVKVENSAAARPQVNLDQADVIYETVTEGGITRFNALFHSKAPKQVAPVRSARASDFYIVPQYRALFAHVGGNKEVMKEFAKRDLYDDMDQFFNPASYWRGKDRAAPHNMFVDVTKIRSAATAKRKYPATLEITGLAFTRSAAVATPSVTLLTVPFAPGNKVQWKYDAVSRAYARSNNGKAHVDKASGAQYRATNVVVMWAQVRTSAMHDALGTRALEIILKGTGRASVFRGGQRFDGTWEAGTDAPPVFRAPDGSAIKLAPGQTWFQVIANDQNIQMR
ncbi:MAG: DUF3048 domain-containing protein [Coriobacteriia bacterium]|nr:DUF3048 domain-containing protein [Coriobacteriia bacterium]